MWFSYRLSILVVAVAVCGAVAGTAGSQTRASKDNSLTVIIPNALADVSQPVIGLYSGIFKKEGVDVTVRSGTGGNTVGLVVSGGADIGLFAPPAILSAVRQGKDLSIIYGTLDVAPISVLVSAPGTTLASLRAKKGDCTFGVTSPGAANYGNGAYMNKSSGINCKLVSFNDVPTEVGAVATGRVDAAGASYDSFADAIGSNKIHILLDARKASQRHFFMTSDWAQDVFFGSASNLASKKDAVMRFMRGIAKVNKLLRTDSPAQLAAIIQQDRDFQTQSLAVLTDRFEADLVGMDPQGGYISSGSWTRALSVESTWGIPNFDPADPSFAYSHAVDMTYFDAVMPAPWLIARPSSGKAGSSIRLGYVPQASRGAGVTGTITVSAGKKTIFHATKKLGEIVAGTTYAFAWKPTAKLKGTFSFCVQLRAPNKLASPAGCSKVRVK
jgi:ABC-type nitrate/sulfonate/bicarbonate transport system substrate-binding protein